MVKDIYYILINIMTKLLPLIIAGIAMVNQATAWKYEGHLYGKTPTNNISSG
jgi:hypothetical protein